MATTRCNILIFMLILKVKIKKMFQYNNIASWEFLRITSLEFLHLKPTDHNRRLTAEDKVWK